MIFHFLQKVKMILWSMSTFWYKGFAKINEKNQVWKKGLILENNSPGLKADFHQQVKKTMKLVFDKWVVNVTPVTNPTPMSKSDKYKVKTIKAKI